MARRATSKDYRVAGYPGIDQEGKLIEEYNSSSNWAAVGFLVVLILMSLL